ncbi:hypothetical protein PGT21_000523 [Puccinia graminis f. sp. tritici]|uniref:Uncharacterized protein n=1 Tax=Puccinia graminis f. sp. tritici TaxID=56615 RepID=A0A5B0M072_PUCGR|nr:hypothetical protein PGT21_000523 [Puccinia graminis f. sp. tritici]
MGLSWIRSETPHRPSLKVKTLDDGLEHPRRTQAWVLHTYILPRGWGSGPAPRSGFPTCRSSPPPSNPALNHHLAQSNQQSAKTQATQAEGTPNQATEPTWPQSPQNPFEAGEPTQAQFKADPAWSDPERKNWYLG